MGFTGILEDIIIYCHLYRLATCTTKRALCTFANPCFSGILVDLLKRIKSAQFFFIVGWECCCASHLCSLSILYLHSCILQEHVCMCVLMNTPKTFEHTMTFPHWAASTSCTVLPGQQARYGSFSPLTCSICFRPWWVCIDPAKWGMLPQGCSIYIKG